MSYNYVARATMKPRIDGVTSGSGSVLLTCARREAERAACKHRYRESRQQNTNGHGK